MNKRTPEIPCPVEDILHRTVSRRDINRPNDIAITITIIEAPKMSCKFERKVDVMSPVDQRPKTRLPQERVERAGGEVVPRIATLRVAAKSWWKWITVDIRIPTGTEIGSILTLE